MSDLAIAAVLAGTVLLAATISVRIGLSVALIELAAGFVVGNSFHLTVPELAELHRVVRGNRAHLPRRRRGGRAAVPSRVEGLALDRLRLVLRAVRGRRPGRVLRARLEPPAGRGRRVSRSRRRASPSSTRCSSRPGLNRELIGKRIMSATFVYRPRLRSPLSPILFLSPTLWIPPRSPLVASRSDRRSARASLLGSSASSETG